MKKLSMDLEEELYSEMKKICRYLNEPMDDFIAAAIEKHLEEKMELVDSEEMDRVLKELQGQGEDEWM
jgi:predicted DNA-binding protein